ncbi:rod shape-determining protein MreD [Verrucomicrobia bacterium LW23]|nr:rod shape-determining protein MreD [Verrucomicrobia bacterium LW23]
MFIYVMLLGLGTLLVQMVLPSITLVYLLPGGPVNPNMEGFPVQDPHVDQFRLVLLPLVIVYAALYTRGVSLILVVGVLGFVADLPSEGRLGLTVINLAIIATIIVTQQDNRLVRTWYVRMMLVLVGTFFYTFLEYFFYLVQISRFDWPAKVWTSMILCSLINAAICPLAFFLFHIIPRTLGWVRNAHGEQAGADPSSSSSYAV